MRRLPRILLWPAALAALGGLLALAWVIHNRVRPQGASETEEEQTPRRPGVVELGAERAEAQGIEDEPARSVSWVPRLTAYGRVVPNPQATAEVRSPFAGTLRADPDTPWP